MPIGRPVSRSFPILWTSEHLGTSARAALCLITRTRALPGKRRAPREESTKMHKPIKYAEKAFTYAAGAAWVVFDKLNQISQNPGFTPKWSDKPLLKSWEKTKPPLGWPRETDSLCPRCVPEIRQQILDGKTPLDVLYNEQAGRDQGADHRARRQDPDGEGLPHPRPLRRRDGHRHGVLQAPGRRLPRPRHPRAQRRKAAPPRLQHHHPRARLGAHHRPDQPLQHDVRSVLHGRQPGGLRPRTDAGKTSRRCSTTPSPSSRSARCRCSSRAASRRISPYFLDAVRYAREVGYTSRAGGHQRHRVRQEPGVLPAGRRSRAALRLPAVRRHRQRRQRSTARSATCST